MAQRTRPRYLENRAAERGRLPGNRLAGWFLALFLAASLFLSLANPALLRVPDDPWLDGSWTAALQEAFDNESPLLRPATTTWGVLEYALFRQGRAGVLVGSDGWLFSSEEFDYPFDRERGERTLADNLAAIVDVGERLAADDARLVVALLPAKARLYPERMGRYRLPAGPAERYEQSLEALQRAGVVVTVDVLSTLERAKASSPVFLRTDTHWTPFGAAVAAEAVAGEITALGPFDWLHETPFVTRVAEPRPHRGDLTGFLPLGPLYEAIGPEDDRLLPTSTTSAGAANEDLFAEVDLPVTLVGTSYSEDERWNFAGALRQALGTDVLVTAQRGEGPYLPMLDYLQGDAYRAAPPEVVVWEIPERYLSEPLMGGDDG
jgi:alginate O-acetyltransferase complex protein AlgJ